MNTNLENHMVLPGRWTGDPNDPNAPDADDSAPIDEAAETIRRLESNAEVTRLRINYLNTQIRDFLEALDCGYFGEIVKAELRDSAFVKGLRDAAGKRWASPMPRQANVPELLRSIANSVEGEIEMAAQGEATIPTTDTDIEPSARR